MICVIKSDGSISSNDRLPGEWEIAEELEISRTDPSRRRGGEEAAEKENLIYRIHGKGTFLGTQLSNTVRLPVSIVIPDFRSAFAAHLIHGVERVFRRQGYRVQVAGSEYSVAEKSGTSSNAW